MSVTGALWHFLLNAEVLNVTNGHKTHSKSELLDAKASVDFALQINKAILTLYGKFLSEDGRHVDYVEMGKSEEFKEFAALTSKLTQVELSALSDDERKAFFLNIYNALVIHGYINIGVPSSGKKRISFFQSVSYKIGGHVYSLDDIEHGILRGNKKHPAFFFLHPQFEKSDPRKQFSLQCDPRIHFALVCGARSCPPLRLYTPSNLQRGLDLAAQAFLGDEENFKVLDFFARKVQLSQILKWYGDDFGKDITEILRVIQPYLSDENKKDLQQVLEPGIADSIPFPPISIVWSPYDWHTNGST